MLFFVRLWTHSFLQFFHAFLNFRFAVSTWVVSGEIQLDFFSVCPWCSFVAFVVKGFVRLTECGVSLLMRMILA
jgi:hypothetical protein